MRAVKIAAVIVECAIQAYGAATVTASRDYVDRKTTLNPYSNGVEQVGYFLGTQTNKVLASKEYVDDSISASSPGDYLNVSNKAYMASSDTLKRLFSVSAYPAWEKSRQSSGDYTAGDIVSYSGMVYRCISTPSGTDAPDEYSSKWEVKTIGDLIAENTPGDYLAVSNRAMSALQSHQSLAPSTNYTDAALGAFAATGTVARATVYGTTTRWTDATGCVWAVQTTSVCTNANEEWAYTMGGQTYTREQMIDAAGGDEHYSMILYWQDISFIGKDEEICEFEGWYVLDGSATAPVGYDYSTGVIPSYASDPYLAQVTYYGDITATRGELVLVTNLVGRVALTNDIPPAVTVVAPSTNAVKGTAADAKATGTALYTGFTEWVCVPTTYNGKTLHVESENEEWNLYADDQFLDPPIFAPSDATNLTFSVYGVTATRRLVTPTKTSQLTNDGDGTNQFATVNLIDASNETFSNAVLSVGVGIDTNTVAAINALIESGDDLPIGGATSVGAILLAIAAALAALKRRVDDKASVSDLPYSLVEPGKWEFSGISLADYDVSAPVYDVISGNWEIQYVSRASGIKYANEVAGQANDLSFVFNGPDGMITATRNSLPGHLIDRAGNLVLVTGATELTLPEKTDGKSRDFYVRLTVISAAGDGSAVTFAATDSGGDAVAWDSMGDPSGTFADGTYLYRITESDDGLMHSEDMMAIEGVEDALEQINDGTATQSALDMKLDATSAAPAFDPTLTYLVGEYVTYGGILYRCKTAVTVAGAWTGDSNWVDVDMTSPDATLDVRSDGRLAVVSADSEILWIQGYDMASASDVVLSCEKVNFYAFASGTTTQTFNMPSAPGGKVGDFVLDIDNSANASTAATATLNGFGTSFDVIVPKGQNLFTDILSFEGGEMCELYFTMTAFGTSAKPAWKVVKQVVEKQEAGS